MSTESTGAAVRVFIADDEEPARERLKELLSDIAPEVPTCIVGEARHGLEALDRVPGSGAQVLLLDIEMPGMGGLELARHLAALEQAPRTIFVTAHDRHAVEACRQRRLLAKQLTQSHGQTCAPKSGVSLSISRVRPTP